MSIVEADPRGFEPLFFSVTGRRVRPGYTMGPKDADGRERT